MERHAFSHGYGHIKSPKEPTETRKIQGKKRPCQIHKERANEVAEKLWGQDPTLTIAYMIRCNEINECFDGKVYADNTVRNWIKDKCPNRSPGRRPTK